MTPCMELSKASLWLHALNSGGERLPSIGSRTKQPACSGSAQKKKHPDGSPMRMATVWKDEICSAYCTTIVA